eukprot:gene963-193_t
MPQGLSELERVCAYAGPRDSEAGPELPYASSVSRARAEDPENKKEDHEKILKEDPRSAEILALEEKDNKKYERLMKHMNRQERLEFIYTQAAFDTSSPTPSISPSISPRLSPTVGKTTNTTNQHS